MICLTRNEFINQIRNQISQIRNSQQPIKVVVNKAVKAESEISEDDLSGISEGSSESESEEFDYQTYNNSSNSSSNKRKLQPQPSIHSTHSANHSKHSKSSSSSKKSPGSRLRLDDALANVTEMEGWSEARIRAYQGMKTNPNAYFYRFNAPGETQRNGAWSKEEDELFMKRLKEFGTDGQWGLFSMSIPGRVGYQVK